MPNFARLLSIDYSPVFGEDHVKMTSFASDTSIFDFDIVIWDPERSLKPYIDYAAKFQGLPSLSDSTSATLLSDIKRRADEFLGFVTSGRTLVIRLCGPQECYVDTGKVEYSGTGRNARGTRIVAKIDLLNTIPAKLGAFKWARGDRIEVVNDDAIGRFLRKYLPHLAYAAYVADPKGVVTARVQGTEHATALRIAIKGGGNIIGIPTTTFKPEESDYDGDEPDEGEGYFEKWPQEALDFQIDLLAAIAELSGGGEIARPAWASQYTTQLMRDLEKKVAKQHTSVERARARLSKLQQTEDEERALEQLYLGSGRQLELRVRDVLKLLGGKVEEAELERADWRVTLDGKLAVLEVKGLTKSAGEKHAAQLEKWVAEEIEKTGSSPKGILVVNTWRETPLAERTKDDFPAQMLTYSEARGHCLVTGIELFGIMCEVREKPSRAEHWRKALLNTVGRISGVPEWYVYLDDAAVEDAEKTEDESAGDTADE